jgi:L-lactate dehydrogenase
VSRQCEGAYGLEGVCLSLPSVVNRQGAHTHFELELSASEHDALQRSAEVLDNVYQQLGLDT